MKKMLMRCLAVLTLIFATSSAFAAPTYSTSVLPTADALAVHHANKKAANFRSTDIIVINYTNTNVVLAYPSPSQFLTPGSSVRIVSPDYAGYTTVILHTADGRVLWQSNSVYPFDTISVRVFNGYYDVRVDHS